MFDRIRLLVCDFDGVLTDNKVYVDQHGVELVRCDRSDGLGLQLVKASGISVLVISKERNAVVGIRCQKLGVPYFQGIDDKLSCLTCYCQERFICFEDVVYIGNDVNDVACMKAVGVACSVQDSYPEAIEVSNYRCQSKGGEGAVREVCDLILKNSSLGSF